MKKVVKCIGTLVVLVGLMTVGSTVGHAYPEYCFLVGVLCGSLGSSLIAAIYGDLYL